MRTISINSHKNFHTLHIVCVYSVVSISFRPPWTVAHQAPLSMEFSDKNTGEGCHFLLQGLFPTQRLNPHLFHLLIGGRILYHCTTWVAYTLYRAVLVMLIMLYVVSLILIYLIIRSLYLLINCMKSPLP